MFMFASFIQAMNVYKNFLRRFWDTDDKALLASHCIYLALVKTTYYDANCRLYLYLLQGSSTHYLFENLEGKHKQLNLLHTTYDCIAHTLNEESVFYLF